MNYSDFSYSNIDITNPSLDNYIYSKYTKTTKTQTPTYTHIIYTIQPQRLHKHFNCTDKPVLLYPVNGSTITQPYLQYWSFSWQSPPDSS